MQGFIGRLQRIAAAPAILVILAILAMLALAGSPVAAQTSQEVQRRAEEAIRRLDLQTDFPTLPELPRFKFSLPPEVLWIVIAIAIAILLYAFRDLIPILRSAQGEDWASDQGGPGDRKIGTPTAALG